MFNVKFCWWLDLNHRPLVTEATALPTEPQPLPLILYQRLGRVHFPYLVTLFLSLSLSFLCNLSCNVQPTNTYYSNRSVSLSHSVTLSLFLPLTTHTLSLSLSFFLSISFTLFHSLSHSLFLPHPLSLSLIQCHPLYLWHTILQSFLHSFFSSFSQSLSQFY